MRLFKLIGKAIDVAFIPLEIVHDWLIYGKRVSDNEIAQLSAELDTELGINTPTSVPPQTQKQTTVTQS